ncbi:hypothetical protein [Amycolatopsis sp. PS_44_ISF1]|uniref:hypothetical protein n=1 Tax=Amycolatopsis sp. PS_44_ISF1 TaxID=2974917 RepID=UPI0028DE7A9B|nr:hypothetical protein [Amycolatopsis sp. PS_44_ISF1]MDT8915759.1 hypothetical protein [Amycolatopsis sp. PS_44_ISF1]MDT8916297.1 hypothetical protein [Amycolatopsis sp. PS_44_ISF1]MDT8916300.1 hypothetical protein [Amycolatopsis sp. PS_44_ISF1]
MSEGFRLHAQALDELLRHTQTRQFLDAVGMEIRDRARANARSAVPSSTDGDAITAIVSVPGEDDEGVYVDVGYAKHHPGFYLWWWEVGTQNHAARPHLRPALQPDG